MKVIEHLENAPHPLVSVEIIPPRRGRDVNKIYKAVESIMPYNPPFIDVTSHAAEAVWDKQPDGTYVKRIKRKSPGTFGLCAAIKYKFDVDPVPHLLCNGFTREETEDALIEMSYLGVENVLVIRGDGTPKKDLPADRTVNEFAVDLVEQVNEMNQGHYLGELEDMEPTDFCVGVSAYPEKHFEAPSMKFDIDNLLKKQEAGAHYAVTQMFFDNDKYFEFIDAAHEAGVTIPILPGLKVLTTKKHINRIPSFFHCDFPDELIQRLLKTDTKEEALEVGVDWAYNQALDLLDRGAEHLHFYIMSRTKPFQMMMDRLVKKM